jgi:hypothetical protein
MDEKTYREKLKTNLYPKVWDALRKIIEDLKENDEIEKHLEKVKQQKVIDEVEIKQAEKMKEKKELGQDYITSASEEEENQSEISQFQSSENLHHDPSSIKTKEPRFKLHSNEFIEGPLNMHFTNDSAKPVLVHQRTSLINPEHIGNGVHSMSYDPIKKLIYYLEQQLETSK